MLYRLSQPKIVYDSYIHDWKMKTQVGFNPSKLPWIMKEEKEQKEPKQYQNHACIYIYIQTKKQNFIGFKVASVSHIAWVKSDDYEH